MKKLMIKRLARLGLLLMTAMLFTAALTAVAAYALEGEGGDEPLNEALDGGEVAIRAEGDGALCAEESTKYSVHIHIINIPYNIPIELASKTYTYSLGSPASGSKAITASTLGIANMTASPRVYGSCTYTFQNKFVLVDAGTTSVVTSMPTDGETLDRIGIDATGPEPVVTVKFADGHMDTYPFDGVDYDIYISPVYSAQPLYYVVFQRIDRIGGASSYWDNGGEAGPWDHNVDFPEPTTEHYQLVYWKDADSGETYQAGSTVLFPDPLREKTTIFYAIWQPSVTVNYHVSGTIEKSEEAFSSVPVYGYTPSAPDGEVFDGWFDANGNRIDDSTAYDAPALTGEDKDNIVQPAVYDVYAQFTAAPSADDAGEPADTSTPQTGDDAPITPALIAMIIGVLGFAIVGVSSRRSRQQN